MSILLLFWKISTNNTKAQGNDEYTLSQPGMSMV